MMRFTRSETCFEVSWEVANAVGGIHTVIASKAEQMNKTFGGNYFVVGPWQRERDSHLERIWEDRALEPAAARVLEKLEAEGIPCRTGRWKVLGHPTGILVDFSSLWQHRERLLAEYWERYGLDSYHSARDYEEPFLFALAAGRVIEALYREWLEPLSRPVFAHAHEWLAAGTILRLKHACPEVACVFTTHATALGRALASRSQLPEINLGEEEARNLARDCGVLAKHSLEAIAARAADCFSTVSDITALECERLLGVKAAVLPNALDDEHLPPVLKTAPARRKARETLLKLATQTTGVSYMGGGEEPLIAVTSGRYEYRNKGLDLIAEALGGIQVGPRPPGTPKLLTFFLVPADSTSEAPAADRERGRVSHALRNPDGDPLLEVFDRVGLKNEADSNVHVVFVPKFLDASDNTAPWTYYELLAGADLTLFPSWYEPWGYTPMESVALGIPTVTSDLTGYSDWAATICSDETSAVWRLKRRERPQEQAVAELAGLLRKALTRRHGLHKDFARSAQKLAREGTWGKQITAYVAAYRTAEQSARKRNEPVVAGTVVDSAYFSMEFGLRPELRLYLGGLGVLAGDFLKAAADLGHRVYGISLAYSEGSFRQAITPELRQDHESKPAAPASFEELGLTRVMDAKGQRLLFEIPLPEGGRIYSSAWRLELGSGALLLLDTDLDENPPELRKIARRLYTSDRRERWLQEYLLGTGGVRLLELLGITPKWFHMNEGHTALLACERIHSLVRARHLTVEEALPLVAANTLFTTHTPVPAGHETFERAVCLPEIELVAHRLRVLPERILELGRNHNGGGDSFSLTTLALGTASRVNAVSKRHGQVAAGAFDSHAFDSKKVFSITNGVHPQTWVSAEWQACFAKHVGKDWARLLDDHTAWARILKIPDDTAWDCHQRTKERLKKNIRERFAGADVVPARAAAIRESLATLDADPMIAVFARRFAAYKRPELLFSNRERLAQLVERYPKTLFVFSGKAHPADGQGQDLIHHILELESSPGFRGHVLFLEDYGMAEAQLLVSGADLWINVPQQPLEASGTSGMKAAMNGVLNLSVNDGWVPEAENGEVSWRVGVGTEALGRATMDWLHSREVYALLETEIVPEFWKRNSAGIPEGWVLKMKQAVTAAVPRFSAQRMVREYASCMEW